MINLLWVLLCLFQLFMCLATVLTSTTCWPCPHPSFVLWTSLSSGRHIECYMYKRLYTGAYLPPITGLEKCRFYGITHTGIQLYSIDPLEAVVYLIALGVTRLCLGYIPYTTDFWGVYLSLIFSYALNSSVFHTYVWNFVYRHFSCQHVTTINP